MITTSILTVVWSIIEPLLEHIGSLPINDILSAPVLFFVDIFRFIGYLLPLDTVFILLKMTLAIWVIKVVIGFAKTIWDVLPIV